MTLAAFFVKRDKTMKLTIQANAKINLFLDMTGQRADGYHTITGVMQAVDLHDRVTVAVEGAAGKHLCVMGPRPGAAEEIVLTCSNPALPTDGKNLAWRAAEAFFAATGYACRRLSIDIDKRIPAAAGLAGGSTDAAAVLRALNELYECPLTEEALCTVGLALGADVPFCIKGYTQLTEGVGEVLTPLSPLPDCEILLACAGEGISTPAAYRALDEAYGNFAPDAYAPRLWDRDAQLAALANGDLVGVCAHALNIFESVILPVHPTATMIKETLTASGALLSMMSGSGPSVFGIFECGSPVLDMAKNALSEKGISSWICRPVF